MVSDRQQGETNRVPRAAVVGGGVAGLATSILLAREGYAVTVWEKNSAVGGRAGTLRADGFRWDRGPSWYLMPDAFEHFYRLLGTSAERELDLVPLNDPAYRVYSGDHEPVDVVSGEDAAAELFESIEPGAGARLRKYLSEAAETYRLAVAKFLYTTFSTPRFALDPEILRRIPRLATLLLGSMHGAVSRRFRDPRLRQILTYPAVFLSNQPRKTPAVYGLMSHTDLAQGVLYPRGGFGTFVDSLVRLAEDAGVEIRTGTEVLGIDTVPTDRPRGSAGWRGSSAGRRFSASARASGVRVRGADGQERSEAADVVVSAADLHHTETSLLPPELRSRPESTWKRRNPGIGCVLAYLGVDGELPQLAHHTLVFSKDWDPDFRAIFGAGPGSTGPGRGSHSESVYVCRPSATDPSVAPAGKENLFVLIPVPARSDGPTSGDPSVEGIVDQVIDLIGRRTGIPDLAERIVSRHTAGPGDFETEYHAWRGNALGLAHTLGQSAFLRGSNASRTVEGLYYAGSTTVPGVGLPMCLISAENVIKRLRGDTSPGPLPEQDTTEKTRAD